MAQNLTTAAMYQVKNNKLQLDHEERTGVAGQAPHAHGEENMSPRTKALAFLKRQSL